MTPGTRWLLKNWHGLPFWEFRWPHRPCLWIFDTQLTCDILKSTKTLLWRGIFDCFIPIIKVIGNLFSLQVPFFFKCTHFSHFFCLKCTSGKLAWDILGLFMKIGPLGPEEYREKLKFWMPKTSTWVFRGPISYFFKFLQFFWKFCPKLIESIVEKCCKS